MDISAVCYEVRIRTWYGTTTLTLIRTQQLVGKPWMDRVCTVLRSEVTEGEVTLELLTEFVVACHHLVGEERARVQVSPPGPGRSDPPGVMADHSGE